MSDYFTIKDAKDGASLIAVLVYEILVGNDAINLDKYGVRLAESMAKSFRVGRKQELEKPDALTEKETTYEVYFFPDIRDALAYLTIEKALQLFETENLDNLAANLVLTRYFGLENTPLYSIDELKTVLIRFISYLDKNKMGLIENGIADDKFTESPWLDIMIGHLYCVRKPFQFIKILLHNVWYDIIPCYNETKKILKGIHHEDQIRIKILREHLFDFKKLVITKFINTNIGSIDILWDNCMQELKNRFTTDDVKYLLKVEKFYTNERANSRNYKTLPQFHSGGIIDIFLFLGYLIQELSVGLYSKTRQILGSLVTKVDRRIVGLKTSNYFELINNGYKAEIDNALKTYQSLGEESNTYWRRYAYELSKLLFQRDQIHFTLPIQIGNFEFFKTIDYPFEKEIINSKDVPFEIPSEEKNIFKKKGQTWKIVFKGTKLVFKNYKGFEYLRYLIQNQHKYVDSIRKHSAKYTP